jgi:1,5-anhydro-D-fructose reductase (1,5-anhydro-D-mannitol-forming)
MAWGWAIWGPGRFAGMRIVPALGKAQDCKAVAVIGRDIANARDFATEYGISEAYNTAAEAFANPAIEAVWIATPHASHREHALACAAAGRHALCEKPLATSVADAQAIVDACQQAGVRLGTGFHLRHHPYHIETRRLVQDGQLGRIISAEAEWSLGPRDDVESAAWRWDRSAAGGGVMTATGVHAIDLLRFVMADEIRSISAIAHPNPAGGEMERTMTCLLEFNGGAQGVVRCSRSLRAPANDLLVEGTNGSVHVRQSLDEQARGTIEVIGASARIAGLPAGTDLYALQADAFAAAIREKREPSASGVDGLRATEAVLAAYAAARTASGIQL